MIDDHTGSPFNTSSFPCVVWIFAELLLLPALGCSLLVRGINDLFIFLILTGVLLNIVGFFWNTAYKLVSLTVAAAVLFAYIGYGYITLLPQNRPEDFALHYHHHASLGGGTLTFDLSRDECKYSYQGIGGDIIIPCTASEQELDDVYHKLRDLKFDTLRYHILPVPHSEGGDFYVEVTAGGHMSRKLNGDATYGVPLTGRQRWQAIFNVISTFCEAKTGKRL